MISEAMKAVEVAEKDAAEKIQSAKAKAEDIRKASIEEAEDMKRQAGDISRIRDWFIRNQQNRQEQQF